jgi:5-methylcytosine-specific restriction endonuclease McrA
MRQYLREPIPEILDAARYLDAAVSAHLAGRPKLADYLIRLANMREIREWTESIWGAKSPHVQYRVVDGSPPFLLKADQDKKRMPSLEQKLELHVRDGYHCRFCGIPVIRTEVRKRIAESYPDPPLWGPKNIDQHAAFQAMWVQCDHLLPSARGGNNNLENLVITCGPCNFGRMEFTFEEVGLIDPRTREPVRSMWDGLERFR